MLRISTTESNVLRLEGRLAGQWIELLEEVCKGRKFGKDKILTLDLSGVTFASKEGIFLLQSLQDQGVECVFCSPFLKELLNCTLRESPLSVDRSGL